MFLSFKFFMLNNSTMIMINTYQWSDSDFRLCEKFTEQKDQTASHWFKKFELEMIEYILDNQITVSLAHYFRTLNAFLTKEIVIWAETDIKMMILLKESSSMQDTVIRFKIKFLEQFSEFLVETESVSFYMKISELK